MAVSLVIASIITWGSNVVYAIQPFIPGLVVIGGCTIGSHLSAFWGSWLSARWYSKFCIGEGFTGFVRSYWSIGSPTCTSLLVSHVVLLAIAIASIICTMIIFLWMWYITFKTMIWPVKTIIHDELSTFAPHHSGTIGVKGGNIVQNKEHIED